MRAVGGYMRSASQYMRAESAYMRVVSGCMRVVSGCMRAASGYMRAISEYMRVRNVRICVSNRITQQYGEQWRAHLLILRLAHAAEDPHDPASVRDLRNEPKLPPRALWLARALAEEKLEEPLGHEQQPEVVLLGDLRALRLDVLQERIQQRCQCERQNAPRRREGGY